MAKTRMQAPQTRTLTTRSTRSLLACQSPSSQVGDPVIPRAGTCLLSPQLWLAPAALGLLP